MSTRRARTLADAIRRIDKGGSVTDPEVVAVLVGRRRSRVPLDDLAVLAHLRGPGSPIG